MECDTTVTAFDLGRGYAACCTTMDEDSALSMALGQGLDPAQASAFRAGFRSLD